MPTFHWLGAGGMRHGVDLRFMGWRLCEGSPGERGACPAPSCVMLVDAGGMRLSQWRALMRDEALRRRTLLVGVGEGRMRTRLLALGFGDVVGLAPPLSEIAVRGARVAMAADALPRWQSHGPLRLDLLTREAFFNGRGLGLHPREFALLWRLMETPGRTVGKRDLLREVWNLSFVPETNSLAVHASRLRAKLALAGLGGWVRSGATDGYCLSPPEGLPFSRRPAVSSPADCNRH